MYKLFAKVISRQQKMSLAGKGLKAKEATDLFVSESSLTFVQQRKKIHEKQYILINCKKILQKSQSSSIKRFLKVSIIFHPVSLMPCGLCFSHPIYAYYIIQCKCANGM